jgi:hypothetical protein
MVMAHSATPPSPQNPMSLLPRLIATFGASQPAARHHPIQLATEKRLPAGW